MIAYFDTSAIVPLLIEEAGSEAAGDIWDQADRLVAVHLVMVEARAALAQARRGGRISTGHLRSAKRSLEGLLGQIDLADVDEDLLRTAGELAESAGLRAYDAVHLAAACQLRDPDFVLVAGDRALLAAAEAMDLNVAMIG